MEHRKKNRKFGRTNKQREALMKSLAVALIEKGAITTTEAKAKSLKVYIDKLVHTARVQSDKPVAASRLLARSLSKPLANKVLKDIVPQIASKPAGSYVRIYALPRRMSDGSSMAQIEFIR